MEKLKKCCSCERGPQKMDQFLDKFGRECSTCLKCRLQSKKNRLNSLPKENRKCEKCDKFPNFNFPGEKSGVYCDEHKEPGMVNVTSLKCEHEGCTTQPCFNFPDKLLARFCAKHREEGMVNLRERPCEKCSKKPFFNFPDLKKGRFCSEHKEDGMVDVLSDFCQHEGCTTRASYGSENDRKRKFCSFHKEDGMICVTIKFCEFDGCKTVPVFNMPGSKRGKFCNQHKQDGMIDVTNKRCKTPLCDIILAGSKNDYCARCTSYLFPEKATKFKTREMKLKEFLTEQYPDKTIVHDKRVDCHLYRPDFVFDMGSHTVVIELDENQHKQYDTSCDNKRLMSIFEGLGMRPMVMLRFNPDRYDNIAGCFKKDGQLSGNGKEWRHRTEELKKKIDFWLQTSPDRDIIYEHLFFDTK